MAPAKAEVVGWSKRESIEFMMAAAAAGCGVDLLSGKLDALRVDRVCCAVLGKFRGEVGELKSTAAMVEVEVVSSVGLRKA